MSLKTLLIAMALLPTACSREAGTPAGNDASTPTIAAPTPTATLTHVSAVTGAAPCSTDELPAYPGAFTECQFLGRWRGVEGMFLVVSKTDQRGRYRLKMQWDLDHHGTFDAGSVSEPAAPGLVFSRDGKELTLYRTDGDATGLKYLAGKKDCLTVAAGEGYCRD